MSDLPMPARKPYPTDLNDEQWALVEPFVRASECGPQEVLHPRREVVNAILYITHTGAQWRYMPHDLPDWQLVYHYFDLWKKNGTLKRIHDALRVKVRKKAGRKAQPTASILDSQSVKTTEEAETKGYDAGKKVRGCRKISVIISPAERSLAVSERASSSIPRETASFGCSVAQSPLR
ncbi:IS5 family transposase [Archangium lansingense]|uniref:IS5 family transposase n=1 Tax=Archangium lansingense TaxID=2995310 RepID=A0ABT4A6N8_9BACT|nr:IS5 family transposase [Archangium lansinium]MCY1077312.1 IS5 family transposase [Archangium lansinium]